jgi:hypothetical protein
MAHAAAIIRKWRKRRWIIERTLPSGLGRGITLDARGADWLADRGVPAQSGKNWGKVVNGVWLPPRWWGHDLIVARLLAWLAERGWQVIPDREVRRLASSTNKVPDAIIIKDGRVGLVEVENSRKNGKALDQMAKAIIAVSAGNAREIAGFQPDFSVVAYERGSRDEHGHQIDHKLRVMSAIKRLTRQPTRLTLAEVDHFGVAMRNVTINEDPVAARVARIDRIRWDPDPTDPGWLSQLWPRRVEFRVNKSASTVVAEYLREDHLMGREEFSNMTDAKRWLSDFIPDD